MIEQNNELPPEALKALEMGNKIEAIKVLRVVRGLGLKESKDLVDMYLRNNPGLGQRFDAIRSETNRKVMLWIVVLIFGALLFLFFSGDL